MCNILILGQRGRVGATRDLEGKGRRVATERVETCDGVGSDKATFESGTRNLSAGRVVSVSSLSVTAGRSSVCDGR